MPLNLKDASGQDVQVPTSEEIAEMITGATKRQIEAANKKLATDITKSSSEAMLAALAEYETKRTSEKPPEAADPGKKATDPELAALKKQVEESAKVIEIERKARLDAEQRQREGSARSSIQSLITEARPELHEFLGDYLFHRVSFDDEGNPLVKIGDDDALPLKDGVAAFLKSKQGAPFMPPPVPGGKQAGGKPPPNGTRQSQLPQYDKPAATEDERIRRALEREQALIAAGNS